MDVNTLDAGDRAKNAWPDARPRHTVDEPVRLRRDLEAFVFLDLFDHEGPPFNGPLHSHSGIATLTYVAEGAVLRHGDLAAFEPSSEAVEFEALADTEFVLGSAVPHEHDLVLGYYSGHTSPDTLRNAEAHIASIKKRLVQEGRLDWIS